MNWNSSGLLKMHTSAFMFYTSRCRQDIFILIRRTLQLCSEADTNM